jgi:hypothetical protein
MVGCGLGMSVYFSATWAVRSSSSPLLVGFVVVPLRLGPFAGYLVERAGLQACLVERKSNKVGI